MEKPIIASSESTIDIAYIFLQFLIQPNLLCDNSKISRSIATNKMIKINLKPRHWVKL